MIVKQKNKQYDDSMVSSNNQRTTKMNVVFNDADSIRW